MPSEVLQFLGELYGVKCVTFYFIFTKRKRKIFVVFQCNALKKRFYFIFWIFWKKMKERERRKY
jgi:hypothetical protein